MVHVDFAAIHRLRLEKRLEVGELAFLAGLDHSIVSRYDRGKVKRATVQVVRALEEALGLKRGELMT